MEFTEELIEKPICNLSGGWKMKLALARAVLLNADLLLLDEPTNHLDVQKQAWLCDFLTGPACEHVIAFGPKRGLAQVAATPGCPGSRGGVFDSGPKANHKNALHSYCAKYWDDVGSQHMPEMRPF